MMTTKPVREYNMKELRDMSFALKFEWVRCLRDDRIDRADEVMSVLKTINMEIKRRDPTQKRLVV